jgi:HNH endonuclease
VRCIFCKQDSSDSRSVEHIMPESIGSRRRVLPRGVVCDKCNNYFARKVEQPILNHHWMRNLRAWHRVPSKKGKFPSLLGHIAGSDIQVNMRLGETGSIQLGAERRGEAVALADAMQGNFQTPLIFTIEDVVPQREMSRFLAKMTLEACAEIFVRDVHLLEEMMAQPFYDSIRNFARYGTGPHIWPFSQRTIFPADTLMQDPATNEWVTAGFGCTLFMTRRSETFFAFVMYGVEFVINVGGPSTTGYGEWLAEHNVISPLVERLGCRHVIRGEGKDRKHYLEGSFEGMKGFEFDKQHGAGPRPVDDFEAWPSR